METYLAEPKGLEAQTNEPALNITPQAFSKQSHQFWTLQVAGWLGYAFVVFFAIIQPQFNTPDFNLKGQLLNLMVETFSGFILSYTLWQIIHKTVLLPLKTSLIISFLSASLLGLVYNVIKLSSYKVIVYDQPWNYGWNMLEFGGWLLFSLATMFVWTSIFFIMLYNTRLQKEHEMLLRAQTFAKDAQLQMLRYQLNPHFMFNTMNAISTLILKNENNKANEMLDKLCEFFRYSLDKNSKSITTLYKELALLDLYLSIEKVRFGERLNVELFIEDEVIDCRVPTMFLQPLVENAIKYAIEPKKQPGKIMICAKPLAEHLCLYIIDDGDGQPNKVSDGFGIGISNTKARLEAMFNGDYSVDITENNQGGTTVTIMLPLVRNNKESI